MLSKKTWYILAAALAALAVWHATQTTEFVYSERWVDGVIVESKVVCGNAFANVLFSEFDDDVLGAATAADCVRLGRTKMLEVAGILAVAGFIAWFGYRHGKQPPRPIDSELRRLPQGERAVEGRRRSPSTG